MFLKSIFSNQFQEQISYPRRKLRNQERQNVCRKKKTNSYQGWQKVSRLLTITLNSLGYGPSIIKIRREQYAKDDVVKNQIQHSKFFRKLTVGSRGEDIIRYRESDWDELAIHNDIICIEDIEKADQYPDNFTIVHMVPCNFHAGYFKLRIVKQGSSDDPYIRALGVCQSGCWVSSKKMAGSGPANKVREGGMEGDSVLSLQCDCSSVLCTWVTRERKYDWPSVQLRERIPGMKGNLVGAGYFGCENEYVEWRLCFNEIELLLVKEWNDTQTKLYKVLKLIKKDILKPKQKEITSYTLKNIVFWLSEQNPQSTFRVNNLLIRVVKALRLLIRSLKLGNLPYCMIPGRNLLAERNQISEKEALVKRLSRVIRLGPKMLLKIEKIRFVMV